MALKYFSPYFNLLAKMPLTLEDFHSAIINILPQYRELECETMLEMMIGLNAPIQRIADNNKQMVDMTTKNINLETAKLCFVDIETTSSNVACGQIIEIGAIIVQNGKILDTFNTLVHSCFVPEEITELTGIDVCMLEDSPSIEDVLKRFRVFLGDCVFVAHNVSFDYNFIAESLHEYNMPPLFNARLCTLDISRKTIISKKHGLSYLNSMLGINTSQLHRAYSDALTSFELYKICMQSFPNAVKTLQDVIDFSKGKIKYPQYEK